MEIELSFERDTGDSTCDGAPSGRAPAPAPPVATTDASSHAARLDARTLRRRARLRGWKLPITDGPFAESKEM